jgi:hypothetical protein
MTLAGDFPLSGPLFADRYRTVPEARVVEMLMLAGWAYERDDPDVARRAGDALRRWIDCGLPCVISKSGARVFDPAEVWTVMKRLGREGGDPYFRDQQVATGRRLVTDLAHSAAPDGPFVVEIHRTFDPSALPLSRPSRFRLPLPFEQVHGHRSVDILGDTIDRDPITLHASRIELRCAPTGKPVTLAARIAVPAPRHRAIAADMDIYLRPREGIIAVSERVHSLARRLAGQGATIAQAVRAFWLFLIESFVCVPIHYDQIDPAAACDWVLDAGCYDCRLGAALFIALCRARGISARMVGGYVLYRRAPTNHFWAEYWCPENGWTPVDFLGWDLSGGGDDPVWRDRFFGQLDARLVTELLPLVFTGAPGVTVPRAWHMLQTAVGDGIEIALTALDGRPVYTDFVRLLD